LFDCARRISIQEENPGVQRQDAHQESKNGLDALARSTARAFELARADRPDRQTADPWHLCIGFAGSTGKFAKPTYPRDQQRTAPHES
jgi:hypothetical protein